MRLREWFDRPERWNKGAYFGLERGQKVSSCLLGGVWLAEDGRVGRLPILRLRKAVYRVVGNFVWARDPSMWNDERATFEQIQQVAEVYDALKDQEILDSLGSSLQFDGEDVSVERIPVVVPLSLECVGV